MLLSPSLNGVGEFQNLGGDLVRGEIHDAFVIASLICSEKERRSSRTMPRCLVDALLTTGILLKVRGGWTGLVFAYLQDKITSIACLVMSGLNFIFHWYAHAVIFSRSLVRRSWDAFTSLFILVKREASSAKSFILEEMLSVRSLVIPEKKRAK